MSFDDVDDWFIIWIATVAIVTYMLLTMSHDQRTAYEGSIYQQVAEATRDLED